MNTKYWAVQWDIAGVNQTTTHSSRDEAEAEAKRVATRYPDRVVFVLEAVNAWVVRCPKPELVPLFAARVQRPESPAIPEPSGSPTFSPTVQRPESLAMPMPPSFQDRRK